MEDEMKISSSSSDSSFVYQSNKVKIKMEGYYFFNLPPSIMLISKFSLIKHLQSTRIPNLSNSRLQEEGGRRKNLMKQSLVMILTLVTLMALNQVLSLPVRGNF